MQNDQKPDKLRDRFATAVTAAFFTAVIAVILLVPTILVITLLKLIGVMH